MPIGFCLSLNLLLPELYQLFDKGCGQRFVAGQLDGRLAYLEVFELGSKCVEQGRAPGAGKGDVPGIGRVIDQEVLADLKGRYLVADHLFGLGRYTFNDLPDLLHSFLRPGRKGVVVFVYGFEVRPGHGCSFRAINIQHCRQAANKKRCTIK